MKKIVAVAVLALLVAGSSTQQASANWCKFNFSCGCNISFEKGGDSCTTFTYTKTCHGQPPCCGPACGGGGYPAEYIYAGHPAAPVVPATPATPATPAQPAFPPAPKPADKEGNQPASYWNTGYGYNPAYASPSTGYMMYPQGGYGGAPSYWYGR